MATPLVEPRPVVGNQEVIECAERVSVTAPADADAQHERPQSLIGAELFALGLSQMLLAREQLIDRR